MKKKVFVFLFFSTMALGQTVSLTQVQDQAKNFSPQTAMIPLIEQAADLQIKILNGNYLPQSSLSGQGSWQSAVTSIPIKIPGFSVSPPPKDQYRATLDVVQNIYDGGFTANQKKLTLVSSKIDANKILLDQQLVKDQVNALFFGIILAKNQKLSLEAMLEDLNSKINKTQGAITNGTAYKGNLLSLKVKNIEIEQQLLELQKRELSAIEGLSMLTGEKFNLQTTFELPMPFQSNLLINERAELANFDEQKNALEASKQLAKAKNLPKVSAFATGGYGKPGLNMLSNQFQSYFIGGIQAKIPLSQIYSRSQSNEIQQININHKKIDLQKESFLLNSQIKAINLKNEIDRLVAVQKTDLELIAYREEIKKTAQVQLDNGIITLSDYISELENLKISKQNYEYHKVLQLQTEQNLKTLLGQ